MSIIKVTTIEYDNITLFGQDVERFLEQKEEVIYHDKTVFGVTQRSYVDEEFGLMHKTIYTAIFQHE
jgi:hypothetical protein